MAFCKIQTKNGTCTNRWHLEEVWPEKKGYYDILPSMVPFPIRLLQETNCFSLLAFYSYSKLIGRTNNTPSYKTEIWLWVTRPNVWRRTFSNMLLSVLMVFNNLLAKTDANFLLFYGLLESIIAVVGNTLSFELHNIFVFVCLFFNCRNSCNPNIIYSPLNGQTTLKNRGHVSHTSRAHAQWKGRCTRKAR